VSALVLDLAHASHQFLLEYHFRGSGLQRNAGIIRFPWLWSSAGGVHYPDVVHDRSHRSKETVSYCESKVDAALKHQTFPLMCIFLLAAGLSLLNESGNQAARIGPIVLFIYLFTIAYSLGEGPVAFQYSAEVFPTIQREQGMAWVVCINNTFGRCLPHDRAKCQLVFWD
jgi:hypothetical protein